MSATPSADAAASPRLWRLAGALAVGHVVLLVTGVLLQGTPSLAEGEGGILRSYVGGDLRRTFTGGYVEVLAFVLLLPVVVFLAHALGRGTERGRWASASAGAFGAAYVTLTLGAGLAPGAASMWGSQHGLDPSTALVVNDVRNVAYFLGLAVLGAHAVSLGITALGDSWCPRTVGWGGVVTGVVLLASAPFGPVGLADLASLLWIAWWVTLAVQMVRTSRGVGAVTARPLAVARRG